MRLHVVRILVVVSIGCGFAAPVAADEPAIQEEIRKQVERMRGGDLVTIHGAPIVTIDFVPRFYENRQFRPAFTNAGNIDALIDEIRASRNDGLREVDFHLEIIERLRNEVSRATLSPAAVAEFDILLTDTIARLRHQLFFGKVNPAALDPNWNIVRPSMPGDSIQALEGALASATLPHLIDQARLKHVYYRSLKSALRSYRELASAGGWPTVASGSVLKPAMVDPRIATLRLRLSLGGDYDWTETGNPALYDPGLEAGVRAFQSRHGLEPDGVIGPATIAALNVPVEERIAQIRANLERARWVLPSLGDDHILVNIAGFYVQLVRGGELVWESRAIVGRPYRETPIFSANMTYMVINPTWTIPPTILREDILPKAAADPAYIASKGYRVVGASGKALDPGGVDWRNARAGSFPYQIVQPPGPDNALGQVKFMFPNNHLVYLHDTPSRTLFDRADRTFSSGCIRVENPFDLADLLLEGQSGWNRTKIDEIRSNGKTTTVYFDKPTPVLILYWTVDPDLTGNVRFLSDVYGRDAAIIRSLDSDDEVARR